MSKYEWGKAYCLTNNVHIIATTAAHTQLMASRQGIYDMFFCMAVRTLTVRTLTICFNNML